MLVLKVLDPGRQKGVSGFGVQSKGFDMKGRGFTWPFCRLA